ncbi:hypothetical protein ABOONEI_2616 [Aciduliprofundum boonei T469]|nr:hypothetical protein ABOONEI_2616 [Aciduliprofundum boonei T469]
MEILCFHSSEEYRSKISEHLKEMGFEFECFELEDYKGILSLWKKYSPSIILTELTDKNIKILEEDIFVVPIIKHLNRALMTKYANRDFIILDELTKNFRQSFMSILLSHKDKKSVAKILSIPRIAKNLIYAYDFEWGRTFIVPTSAKDELYKILPKISDWNVQIFMAIRERAGVPKNLSNAKIVWITDIVGKDRIKPHNLTILTDSIIRFIEENEHTFIVVDCIEYLLLYNDFINVLRNIELINSYVMEHNAILIIITDNEAYTTKEYSLLRRYAIEWKGV